MSELAKWYVVHTYSGYENSVAANILKAAENRRMQDLIQEVNIPMETVKEITDSGEKTVERKVFPGYVLVKMVLTDESWHLVHNVRGAAGFVGSDGKAIPLTEQEIYDLGVEHHEVVVGYEPCTPTVASPSSPRRPRQLCSSRRPAASITPPACPREIRSRPSARKICARSQSRRCPISTAPASSLP